MTMTLGPRSVMEMGTSLVLFFFKKLFWGRREAGSYVYVISLRIVWTLLLVMRYAKDKCSRAIGFLLCTLGLEVFYRKQGVCNNIKYRNLKQIPWYPFLFWLFHCFLSYGRQGFLLHGQNCNSLKFSYANPRFSFWLLIKLQSTRRINNMSCIFLLIGCDVERRCVHLLKFMFSPILFQIRGN